MSEVKKGSELTVQKREIAEFIGGKSVMEQVAKVLPKHLTPERMTRITQTAVMRKPELQQAALHPVGKVSLLNALMICSQAGLEPDGRMAHLVPFWNSKAGCYEVQVIFDWKGLVALGLRNGFDSVYPEYACENDQFDAWIENGVKRLVHRVDWKRPRGNPYLFYCVTMRGTVLDYEIMTFDETETIRERSKAKDKGPWITDTLEMRKKCPIRRMSKRWDLDPEIRDVINAEDDGPDFGNAPVVMARPIFDTRPKIENGHGETAPPAAPAAPANASGDVPEPPSDDDVPMEFQNQQAPSPVKALRELAKAAGIKEGIILEFLVGIGATDGSVGSLEELQLQFPDLVQRVLKDWGDISARILSVIGGKK